jgi:hypothetical protein
MKIINETNFSETSIKSVATWVGLDLSEDATLVIKRALFEVPNRKGAFYGYMIDDMPCYVVELSAAAEASTLGHELRHAAQCQALTVEVFDALYDMEQKTEGYKGNVFEIDAREYTGHAA